MEINGEKNESFFVGLKEAPVDAILGIEVAFRNDDFSKKVNLGIGAYRTSEGKPYIFKAVRKAEEMMMKDETLNKEYLLIDGLSELKELTQKLAFGEDSDLVKEKRICSVQSISGTGALKIAADFISRYVPSSKVVYLSAPTWPNHQNVFKYANLETKEYPYWHYEKKCIDIEGMLNCLSEAEERSIVVLHACAHNPTGMDLTEKEWYRVKECIRKKKLISIIDMAYQGFATGDIKKDSLCLNIFQDKNSPIEEFFVAQSFAKNFGLYGERIGMLHIVCNNKRICDTVLSNVKIVIRSTYSSPPKHGAYIVYLILKNKNLYNEWLEELKNAANSITSIRNKLYNILTQKNKNISWTHIQKQIGMFSFTGLTPEQCERMINKWHVYLLRNGRISLSGLNDGNVEYVADAILDCITNAC